MTQEAQIESVKERLIEDLTSVLTKKKDFDDYTDGIKNELSSSKDECLGKIQEAEKSFEVKSDAIISGVKSELATIQSVITENFSNVIAAFEESSAENIKKQNLKFDELYTKVSSLLPHAAVESIAYSYKESAKKHEREVQFWNLLFFVSIFGMILVSITAGKEDILKFFASLTDKNLYVSESSMNHFFNVVLRSLPFDAPLIWLAIYGAKQGKKSKRLLEEYQHKYTSAMTFIGMQKNAFEANAKYKGFSLEGENQNELNRKFISLIFENPSSTLEKSVTADLPTEELLPLLDKVGPENIKALLEIFLKRRQ